MLHFYMSTICLNQVGFPFVTGTLHVIISSKPCLHLTEPIQPFNLFLIFLSFLLASGTLPVSQFSYLNSYPPCPSISLGGAKPYYLLIVTYDFLPG